MRVFLFLFLFLPVKGLLARDIGFKSIPIKPFIGQKTYYLKPIYKNNEKKFIAMECKWPGSKTPNANKAPNTNKDTLKPADCAVFSPITFSLSQLEHKIKDLEKHDAYYMALDAGLFVGIFFNKLRSWVFKTKLGRVFGLIVLSLEINDFLIQRKQLVSDAVFYYITEDLAPIKDLNTDLQNVNKTTPAKSWIKLKAMNVVLLKQFLNLFN